LPGCRDRVARSNVKKINYLKVSKTLEIKPHTRTLSILRSNRTAQCLVAVCVCAAVFTWTTTATAADAFSHLAIITPIITPPSSQALWSLALSQSLGLFDLLVGTFIRLPLERLYMLGPALSGWGFWAGKRLEDICSELTKVPAATWELMRHECEALVRRQFESFYVAVTFCLYALLTFQAVSYVWFRYTVMNPLLHNVRMLLRGDAASGVHNKMMPAQDKHGHCCTSSADGEVKC
jgi:hypothetical protein